MLSRFTVAVNILPYYGYPEDWQRLRLVNKKTNDMFQERVIDLEELDKMSFDCNTDELHDFLVEINKPELASELKNKLKFNSSIVDCLRLDKFERLCKIKMPRLNYLEIHDSKRISLMKWGRKIK